jgi:hypothetical protein
VLPNKCGGCHTTGWEGGHSIGAADIDSAYADSQLTSYSNPSHTKGAQAADRITSGSIPKPYNSGGPVSDDTANVCTTASEFPLLNAWSDGGQSAP